MFARMPEGSTSAACSFSLVQLSLRSRAVRDAFRRTQVAEALRRRSLGRYGATSQSAPHLLRQSLDPWSSNPSEFSKKTLSQGMYLYLSLK